MLETEGDTESDEWHVREQDKTEMQRRSRETKSESQLTKISRSKITPRGNFQRSWPAPSPMCMVRGCFLTILRRVRRCFLHTEPLLEAQSCCRVLQQQTLPLALTSARFQPKRDYARSCANWTRWLARVCASVPPRWDENEELNKITSNGTCYKNASPTFPESSKPSHSLRADLQGRSEWAFLYFTALEKQQFIAGLWLNC